MNTLKGFSLKWVGVAAMLTTWWGCTGESRAPEYDASTPPHADAAPAPDGGGFLVDSGPGPDTSGLGPETTPPTGWTATEEDSLFEYLVDLGNLAPLGKDHDIVTSKDFIGADSLKYTQENHEVLENITNLAFLGLNDDVIWPGNVIKGERAHEFIYVPVSLDRAPVTISLSLEGAAAGTLAKTIAGPKLSTVRQGIADLLKGALLEGTKVPAKVDFRYQQVYSESQMSLFLNTNLSYSGLDVNAHFDWKSTSKKNKIFADYTQVYYSVDLDYPASPVDLFARTQSVSRIKAALPAGSAPMYVAGVSYGLRALMFIETDYKEQEMKAALDAAYKGAFEAKLESGFTAQQILSSSNIRILVYGGSTAGLSDLELDFDGFKKVVRASNQFSATSPGVPLSYKFRNLSDNTLAQVSLTSQYNIVTGQPCLRLTVTSVVCDFADDEGADNTVDINKLYVNAGMYNTAGTALVATKQVYGWDGWTWGADTGTTLSPTEMNSLVFYLDPGTVANTYIQVGAYARDDDGGSALNNDDIAENANALKLTPNLYTNHEEVFRIGSGDNFALNIHLKIERLN